MLSSSPITNNNNNSYTTARSKLICVILVSIIVSVLVVSNSDFRSPFTSSSSLPNSNLKTTGDDYDSTKSENVSPTAEEKRSTLKQTDNGPAPSIHHTPTPHSSSITTIIHENSIAKERYSMMTKKKYVFHKSYLSSPRNFAGLSFFASSFLDDDDDDKGKRDHENEVFINSRGFAEVNWSKALNCADQVITKFFSSSSSKKITLPFLTVVAQQVSSSSSSSTSLNFGKYIISNWDAANDMSNAKGGDGGVKLRALAFCLKGGGAGDKYTTSTEKWSKRGGAGKLTHPYVAALHGGVSPLRAIGQGFRSAQYLGVVPHAISEDALFARKKGIEDFSERAIKIHYDILSKNTLEEIRAQKSMPNKKDPFVIVDLGGGHGTLLNAMCPPHPNLWCFGIDFAEKLIEQGTHFFPHLDLRPGISAPHLPTGSADAVLSNAVLPMIKYVSNCGHLREMIRLLKPGKGVGQLWQMSMYMFSRFHPSFFVADEDTFLQEDEKNPTKSFLPDWDENEISIDPRRVKEITTMMRKKSTTRKSTTTNNNNKTKNNINNVVHFSKFFSTCPGNLGRYISRLDIVADDPHLPIYTPQMTRSNVKKCSSCQGGCFGVRIFRNNVEYNREKSEAAVFEPEIDSSTGKMMDFTPPKHYATSLKAPTGLVDTCLSTAENWKKCQEFDEFAMTKMYECKDKLVKNPADKSKAWCPKEHALIVEKRKKLWGN